MGKFFTVKVWILMITLIISLLVISPNPWASGIQIKSVEAGSLVAEQGIAPGEILRSINDKEILTLKDFEDAVALLENEPKLVEVKTDSGTFTYNLTSSMGFDLNNLTVIDADQEIPIENGMIIEEINGEVISNISDFRAAVSEIIPKKIVKIVTNKREYAYLTIGKPGLRVENARKSNIKKGLDLEGGIRVLLKPVSDKVVSESDVNDLIRVLDNRLNVYGLSDLKIQAAKDLDGTRYVLVEIAGASKDEVKELIAKQGKFEAKIANQTVFRGGKEDITFVCRDDGSCAGIRPNCPFSGDRWICRFEFTIHLSADSARKHAEVTDMLTVIDSPQGRQDILNETIDFYLDDKLVDQLNIGADLKGSEATRIAISGSGVGTTKKAAVDNAAINMDRLQTILITGSLPLDIKIVKLDSISPIFGASLIKNAFLVGFMALIGVAIVIFIRYRTFKIVVPMIFTVLSETFIILGFAAFIQWNLDLAAIAGIIAAVGTGVDHQIVITDEVMRKGEQSRFLGQKEKIKRAFFIIMVAYVTTIAAMFPLLYTGAGLIRGFAFTTIIGTTIGVFITRPAFASVIDYWLER